MHSQERSVAPVKHSRFHTPVLAVVALASLASIDADAITYIYKGTASGTLNGVSFSDQSFLFQIEGDTGALYNIPPVIGVPALSSTISLGGGSPISITDNLVAYVNTGGNQVGFYDDTLSGFNILNLVIPGVGLDSYDMVSDFGPVTTSSGISYYFPGAGVGTSSGNLIFSSVGSSASFQAVTSAVPDLTSSGALAAFSFMGTLIFARLSTQRAVRRD